MYSAQSFTACNIYFTDLQVQAGAVQLWARREDKVQDPSTSLDGLLAYQARGQGLVPVHIRACSEASSRPIEIIQFYVKSLSGKTITLQLPSNATIGETKEAIQDKAGIPTNVQRLIMSGIQLEDDITLGDYNVQQDGCMDLILRIRGGMLHQTSGRWVAAIPLCDVLEVHYEAEHSEMPAANRYKNDYDILQ